MTQKITLKIRDNINNEVFDIKVPLSYSGYDLKMEIANEHENLFADNMRLVFSGKLLNDFFSLDFQKIKNNSAIFLISQPKPKKDLDEPENQIKNVDNNDSSTTLLHILQVNPRVVNKRKAKLRLESYIVNMDHIFSSNTIYIYHGEILDKYQTFDYYGIHNDSIIVVLPEDYSNENPALLDKWIKMSSDSETFQNLISSNANKSCKAENSRLIDMRYNNIELNRKHYLSVFNEQNVNLNNYGTSQK